MANKIQFRRGTKAQLTAYGFMLNGEPGYTTDTGELFIGNGSGANTKVSCTEAERTTWNGKLSKSTRTWTPPTLESGWVNYGGVEDTAGYLVDSDGFVHLRGLIKSGTDGKILTLPAGFRPSKTLRFSTVTNSKFGSVSITSAGELRADIGYDNVWFSLNIPPFMAEQ